MKRRARIISWRTDRYCERCGARVGDLHEFGAADLTGMDAFEKAAARIQVCDTCRPVLEALPEGADVATIRGEALDHARLCPGCRSMDGEHDFGPTCTLAARDPQP